MPPLSRVIIVLLVSLVFVGCVRKPWSPKNYQTNESLYVASKQRLDRGKLDDAIAGFEQLTLDLPARDTLLSRAPAIAMRFATTTDRRCCCARPWSKASPMPMHTICSASAWP